MPRNLLASRLCFFVCSTPRNIITFSFHGEQTIDRALLNPEILACWWPPSFSAEKDLVRAKRVVAAFASSRFRAWRRALPANFDRFVGAWREAEISSSTG